MGTCTTDEKSTHKKSSSDLPIIEQFTNNFSPLVNVVIQYKHYIYFNYCYLKTKTIFPLILKIYLYSIFKTLIFLYTLLSNQYNNNKRKNVYQ